MNSLPATPVRQSVATLIPHLEYVTIDEAALETLATMLADESLPLPEWRASVFPTTETDSVAPADVLDFLFVGNAINFQFTDHDTGTSFTAIYNSQEWSGAFGMWACLKQAFDEDPTIVQGEQLAALSQDAVDRLFAPAGDTPMPMLSDRHRILTQVGDRLLAEYDGRFATLVEAAAPRVYADGDGIVDHLTASLPSFRDTASVMLPDGSNHEVVFAKRAQLAVAMAYGRFQNRDAFILSNPAELTIFADYNLPNVLRAEGILEYAAPLADRIDNHQPLPAGSRQEIELRAATIAAADKLLNQLRSRRSSPIDAAQLDYALFKLRDTVDTPAHRSRTTAY